MEICMTVGCDNHARVPDHLCAECRSLHNAKGDDAADHWWEQEKQRILKLEGPAKKTDFTK